MKWGVIGDVPAAVKAVVVVPALMTVQTAVPVAVIQDAKVAAWVIAKVTVVAPVVIINLLMEGFGPPV